MTRASRDSLQFDLHARYSVLATALAAAFPDASGLRILDVGAGPQRLTELFLPEGFATVTRTDVAAHGDPELVVVEPGAALPFADAAFDAVVAMDVLEHVPPGGRTGFLRECLRVGARLVVIAAPIGSAEVAAAEESYAAAFAALFGEREPFLDEHAAFGLPKPNEVEAELTRRGLELVCVDNVRLSDWLALNVSNLVLSSVNDGDALRSAVSQMQNAAIPTQTPGAAHYRRFYICTPEPDLAAAIRLALASAAPQAPADRPDQPLLVLAQELKRYAERWHGPSLEAQLADRELAVATLQDVVAAKDRHIADVQAMADGLAAELRRTQEARAAEAQAFQVQLTAAETALAAERQDATVGTWAKRLRRRLRQAQAART